jgi:hypothetical protein
MIPKKISIMFSVTVVDTERDRVRGKRPLLERELGAIALSP